MMVWTPNPQKSLPIGEIVPLPEILPSVLLMLSGHADVLSRRR